MSRRPLIAGNWKMHKDHLEAIDLVQRFNYRLEAEDYDAVDIAVIPPFTDLRSMQTLIDADRLPIALGAQNCHWEDSGAFTGEVSPPMLARLNVRYVICGHSERRHLFAETDEIVNRKVQAVLRHAITPILCVGETLEQREAGQAKDVVVGQLHGALEGVGAEQVRTMVIAYEPVWAIGTGRTATPDDANEMCAMVRSTVADRYAGSTGEGVRVQYGGSVMPGNVVALMRQPDIDGALVGGASLSADDFAVICRFPRL
ncbi:MAG: triose-phosphate isomerase [Nitriliruptorales bacterium]|nr:triose-phosphate isomerase [Nitriliruptorales bacterium]